MPTRSTLFFILLRRSAAFLYDCLLLLAVFFIVTAVLVVGINEGEAMTHPAYYLLLYVIGLAFFGVCWRYGGQTLGMKAWHLQLINEAGGRLTFRQCATRYVLGTVAFGFTYLHAVFDTERRTLHDRLSETRIIKVVQYTS